MILIRLVRFIFGYLRVRVTGMFPERFLNVCATQGVRVWNTRRAGEGIEFCTFLRDYAVIRKLRKRCGASLRVRRKYGLPFITARYRRRKGIIVGALIYIAVLMIMPKFVWGVNVSGLNRLTDSEVRNALNDIGIYSGAKLKSIDADNMRLQLAMLLPDVSWAAVNIDGCFVNVEVREAQLKQQTDARPSNMVATCDGRITAVYVRSGSATVKVGDAVVKGDMLVSGTEEYSSGQTVFRHSDAEIIAEVERTLTVKIPLDEQVVSDTGRVKQRYVLTAFDYSIPLYIGEVGFDYRLKTKQNPISIGGVELPFSVTEGSFYEVERTTRRLSESKAYEKGVKQLDKTQEKLLDGFEIISRDITSTRKGDTLVLTAKYLCSGNIAKTEYFYIANE